MKKLYGSAPAKLTAVLLCLAGGIVTAAGLLSIIGITLNFRFDGGVITKEKLLANAYEIAGQTYAASLLTLYSEDPDPGSADMLEDTNLDYAVVGASHQNFEKLDLSDESIYLYKSSDYTGYDDILQGGRHWYYMYRDDSFPAAWRAGVSCFNIGAESEGWNETVQDKHLASLRYFWVLYRVKDTLQENGDLFVQGRNVVNTFWTIYQWIIPGTVTAGILLVVSSVFLIAAAGHREDTEAINRRFTDRMPFAILTAIVLAVEFAGAVIGFWVARFVGYANIRFIEFGLILTAIVMGLALILYMMSIAVRVKTGTFWQTTLLCRLTNWIRSSVGTVRENIPLVWMTVLFLTVLTIIEAYVIRRTEYNNRYEMAAFVIYKLFAVPAVLLLVFQFDRIKRRTRAMAEGNLAAPIETKGMYWVFRDHAEDINRIREGMSRAVEERMKSERLKTELITNVSHDIKTPLTSIINYTDLIRKEEIESPVVRDYVDVLSRQSDRLKKLIEDLIEASKASTGNLELHMEDCDVSVILAQAVAEFDDKFRKNDLELLVSQPEKRTVIQADGRYLWRLFENLLSNISKYALEGTRVYIDVTEENRDVLITFKNISRQPLNISSDELMERFVRGDESRSTEGSGLGLSIAGSLASLMGGSLQLEIDGDLFKVILKFSQVQ